MQQNNAENLSRQALSHIFSNLAKASEKQQKYELQEAYSKLSAEYKESARGGTFESLKENLSGSLAEDYPDIMSKARDHADRGVQRALVWGQKVTTIQKSLIDRYLSKGEALFEGKNIYICEACGFISLGSEIPALCPVCKAPSSRFSKV